MNRIIVTDSTAYLPKSLVAENNIKIVPLNVHIKDMVFKEGSRLSNMEYFTMLKNEPVFPSTSQPATGEFLRVFEQLNPGDEALVILISSQLSGALHSAQVARDMLGKSDINIYIFDSLSTIIGLEFLIRRACELLHKNMSMTQIIEELEQLKHKIRLLFIVDDLEYLARGGRISHLSKHVGNILQIKPILHLNQGKIEVFDKVRTKQKAINHILNEVRANAASINKIGVIHVNTPEECRELKDMLAGIYSGEILTQEVGPVIGSHTGPGAVGIAFY